MEQEIFHEGKDERKEKILDKFYGRNEQNFSLTE